MLIEFRENYDGIEARRSEAAAKSFKDLKEQVLSFREMQFKPLKTLSLIVQIKLQLKISLSSYQWLANWCF